MVVRNNFDMPIMCTNGAVTGTVVKLKVRQNTDMNFDVSEYESHKSYAQVFKVFVKVIKCNVERLECDS